MFIFNAMQIKWICSEKNQFVRFAISGLEYVEYTSFTTVSVSQV